MVPATDNITITRGDYWSRFVRLRPRNVDGSLGPYTSLTGWTGKAQIRIDPDAVDPPLASMVVALADQVAYPGGVLVSMSATITSALNFSSTGNVVTFEKQIGYWDLQLTNTLGEVNTYLQGTVTLRKDISR